MQINPQSVGVGNLTVGAAPARLYRAAIDFKRIAAETGMTVEAVLNEVIEKSKLKLSEEKGARVVKREKRAPCGSFSTGHKCPECNGEIFWGRVNDHPALMVGGAAGSMAFCTECGFHVTLERVGRPGSKELLDILQANRGA